jgi:hypothetical protein
MSLANLQLESSSATFIGTVTAPRMAQVLGADAEELVRKRRQAQPTGTERYRALAKRPEIESALRRLAPRIPKHEFEATLDHALTSKGIREATPETAAWLSLVAYVRHALTEYDDLLTQGYDHDSARFFVAAQIDTILSAWGVRRRLRAVD